MYFMKNILDFLKSTIPQILGMICHSLVLNFGTQYAVTIGSSYQSFLTTASWCFLTTGLLLLCYLFSPRSLGLIRQSLFVSIFFTNYKIDLVICYLYMVYSLIISEIVSNSMLNITNFRFNNSLIIYGSEL